MAGAWNRRRTMAAATVAAGLLALVAPRPAAAQGAGAAAPADLKAPQPDKDAAGRAIPGHFTLTICKGTSFDMTPRNGRQDRYQTPHGVRVTSTSGTAAKGGEQGDNGTIRISSGGPGVPAATGETTVTYDIVDRATGQKVETVTVKVKVIDCSPPAPPARAGQGVGGVRAQPAAFTKDQYEGFDEDEFEFGDEMVHVSSNGSGLWYPVGFNARVAVPVTPRLTVGGGMTWGHHAQTDVISGVRYDDTATTTTFGGGVQCAMAQVLNAHGSLYLSAGVALERSSGSFNHESTPATSSILLLGGGGLNVSLGSRRLGLQVGAEVGHVFTTPSRTELRIYADVRVKFGGAQ